jgi:hypothetical protein
MENGQRNIIHSKSEPFQRYEAMLAGFAGMVRGETENPYTYDYGLQLFQVILKCCGMGESEK